MRTYNDYLPGMAEADLRHVNENVNFEDYQIKIDNELYSIDGSASVIEGNVVDIYIEVVAGWSESEQSWILATREYDNVIKVLECDEEFKDKILEKCS